MTKERKLDRKRAYGGGRPSGLKTMDEKLFYALWYLKTYPTFDIASLTKSDRRYDKKVLEKSHPPPHHLPEDVTVWTDTGFQGFLQYHPNTLIPYKHAKGKPLTPEQKEHNRIVSSFRVIAERAISGIKRMRSTPYHASR